MLSAVYYAGCLIEDHYAECCYAECRSSERASVIELSVIQLKMSLFEYHDFTL
jgi:hypothetical protein